MDAKFLQFVEGLHEKYKSLITMDPVSVDTAPSESPIGGVYLFSEHGKHLYVGRTKRIIRQRLKDHVSTASDCPFAWLLSRKKLNKKATYTTDGSRKQLLQNRIFIETYKKQKARIRKMQVRYVAEQDPTRQALLEIYVAVVAGAEFNDFLTH
jgi:hypothetical protein